VILITWEQTVRAAHQPPLASSGTALVKIGVISGPLSLTASIGQFTRVQPSVHSSSDV